MKRILKNTFFLAVVAVLLSIITVSFTGPAYADDNTNVSEVYLGGNPVGIIAQSEGLVVTEIINVTTDRGSFSPALEAGIEKGDIVISINGEKINDPYEMNEIIKNTQNSLLLTILRGKDKISVTVVPEFDIAQSTKKIGIAVKNYITGIGTMTFIKDNGKYGALGHQITDSFGNADIYGEGKVFFCDITGYKTASENKPGELIGKINIDIPAVGTIKKNKICGIYGEITENNFYTKREKIQVGTKNNVRPGKAYIVTTIGQNPPEKFEIEIVKTLSQNQRAEKGMVIRVTDKKLLSTTKGILQGMSGSPIIQNDKLVGAVTHVFTNDSKMGYGIYIDWMINEA